MLPNDLEIAHAPHALPFGSFAVNSGDFYSGSWLANGKVSARGVGMKVQEGVAIGWRRITD